jgi:hypothetical protein
MGRIYRVARSHLLNVTRVVDKSDHRDVSRTLVLPGLQLILDYQTDIV